MLKKALRSSMFTVLFLMIASTAMAAYSIRDDATGGDCTQIGAWDAATKTCMLTTDISEGIYVGSDYITLDGNGHTVNSSAGQKYGIRLENRTGVTVKNVTIKNFPCAVYSWPSGVGNTFSGNVANSAFVVYGSYNIISGNNVGGTMIQIGGYGSNNTIIDNRAKQIGLMATWNNVVRNNIITGIFKGYPGIDLVFSGGNRIENNIVSNATYGIYFQSWASNNIITGNTFSLNSYGVYFTPGGYPCDNNKFYRNNFIGNTTQAYVSMGTGNTFNLDAQTGGNYWSNYDTPTDGCNDLNHDGLCDVPYYFSGGIDYLPWTKPNGWLTPEVITGGIVSAVDDLVADGILTGGEGTALSATLSTAIKKFEADNVNAACNALDAFINQVEARVNAGALTVEEGQALIDAATLDECQ